ncbi:MAG: acyl-CoA synthetase [Sphingomonadales bacterium]|nr:acyl-CoA synthetase [Sphingomonadales bacterium]
MNDVNWPNSTLVSNVSYFLTKTARRLGEEIAIVFNDDTWTWREFDARVSALCWALHKDYGIRPGDRILVQSANSNQMLEIMMAAFRLGAIWVPSNFRNGPEELAYQAEKSRASILLHESAFATHADRCRTMLDHTIAIDGENGIYEELLDKFRSRSRYPDAFVSRDDPCWMFFTSGSTGRPKASVLTQGQMIFTTLDHLNDLMPGTGAMDASLVVAPLSHGAGAHQITQIAAGAKSVLMPSGRFDIERAWHLVEQWRVSNMFTVPTIVKLLVEHPAVARTDHSSLRYVVYAGAPMYREDQKRALSALGPVLVQYYGLGEVTGAITVLRPGDHHLEDSASTRAGTCGVERTGIRLTIQDDDGNVVPPHQTGEICVIGQAVFPGYFEDEAANAKAFRDGWFRTGDMGHVDEQGYIYITGRSSDMFISGGSNVYPREIEEILLSHPDLSEVAILGIPDPKWGEVGIAVCVAREGCSPTHDQLAAFLGDKVAKYKQPSSYLFLGGLPKTAVGKVTKKLLREQLVRDNLIPA